MKDIPDSLLPLAIKIQSARTAWTLTNGFNRSRVAPKSGLTGLKYPDAGKKHLTALTSGKPAGINTVPGDSRICRSHVAPESRGIGGGSTKHLPNSLLPLAIKTQPARIARTLAKGFARSRVAPIVTLIGKVQRKRGAVSSTCQAALSGKILSLCLDLPSITLRQTIQENVSLFSAVGLRKNPPALFSSWKEEFTLSFIRPDCHEKIFVLPDVSLEHSTRRWSKNPDSTGNECANPLIVAPFTLPSRSRVAPVIGLDWNFEHKNTAFSQPMNNKGLACRVNAAWNHDRAPFGIHPPAGVVGDSCGWEAGQTRSAHAQSDAVLSAGREVSVTLDCCRCLKIIRAEKCSQLQASTQPDHVQTRASQLSPRHVHGWKKQFTNRFCESLSPVKNQKMALVFSKPKNVQNPVRQKNIIQKGQKILKNLSLPLRSPYAPSPLPYRSRGRSRSLSTRRLQPRFRRHGYIDMEKHKSWLYASPDEKSGFSQRLKIGEKTVLTASKSPAGNSFCRSCYPVRLRLSSSRGPLCPRQTLVKTNLTMPDRAGLAWKFARLNF